MPARTVIDRLDEARPLILRRSELVVDEAEEHRILQAVLRSRVVADVDMPSGRSARSRPSGWMLAAAAVLASAALASALILSGDGQVPAGHHEHVAGPPPASRGSVLKLASYTFTLPPGFRSTTTSCAPSPSGRQSGLPMKGSTEFAAAASADGGCIEVRLVAGATATPPTGAKVESVRVYEAFLTTQGPSTETLYVEIPAAVGLHALVLVASGISAGQLVAIANSGLPTSVGSTRVCLNGGCG